jgi:D-beta-D-heptose 7-phosphate kinase/D-beta-D-heptose 1-phosphate adenosyltransferase
VNTPSAAGRDPTGAIPIAEARAWRAGLRASGRRLAFTNGCFDILHAGHVRLLTAARAAADALVVALNTDASVRRLKGAARPLVPEDERAELLAALEAVDRVVLFDEDTPREAILALTPDVLVKGADWAEDAIVGASEVKGWGGRVVRVELVPGKSTTTIIERIRTKMI